ncbi:hypothetical protein [Roseomonas sp. WA12]
MSGSRSLKGTATFFFFLQKGTGHCAVRMEGVYSSWRPAPGARTGKSGLSEQAFAISPSGDGEAVRRPIRSMYPRHEQSVESDRLTYGDPVEITAEGLDTGEMRQYAQAEYLSGGLHGPYKSGTEYILASFRSHENSHLIYRRQNCVTSTLRLLLIGAQGLGYPAPLVALHPWLSTGRNSMNTNRIITVRDLLDFTRSCCDTGLGHWTGSFPPPGPGGGGIAT